MKHEELKIGNIVSVSLTYGATTVENQEFVEVEFDVVKVTDIHQHKPLIKISYSPEVWVLDEAIQGIPISELVIKRLGWTEIDRANLNVAPPILSSVKKAYQRDNKQLYLNYDDEFYFVRSKSTQPNLVAYVHELQNLGIHDLEPNKLLNK